MLNGLASLAMSTCILEALPGKLDIKIHSPSILNNIPISPDTTLIIFYQIQIFWYQSYQAWLGECLLNWSASLPMSTCILGALPGKLDIKRHSPSILYDIPISPDTTLIISFLWRFLKFELSDSGILLDFLLTVKAATLIFICGCGSAISSAKEGKSGMSLCASVYMCFVVTCWERADLLALVCGVYCESVTFPLVSWVRCGTWLYRFLIFAPLLTLFIIW